MIREVECFSKPRRQGQIYLLPIPQDYVTKGIVVVGADYSATLKTVGNNKNSTLVVETPPLVRIRPGPIVSTNRGITLTGFSITRGMYLFLRMMKALIPIIQFRAEISGRESLEFYRAEVIRFATQNLECGLVTKVVDLYDVWVEVTKELGENPALPKEILNQHLDIATKLATVISPDAMELHPLIVNVVLRRFRDIFNLIGELTRLLGDPVTAQKSYDKATAISQLGESSTTLMKFTFPFVKPGCSLCAGILSPDVFLVLGFRTNRLRWEERDLPIAILDASRVQTALSLSTESLSMATLKPHFETFQSWVEALAKSGIAAIRSLAILGPEWLSGATALLYLLNSVSRVEAEESNRRRMLGTLPKIQPGVLAEYLNFLRTLPLDARTGAEWLRSLYPALYCIQLSIKLDLHYYIPRDELESLWALNPPPEVFYTWPEFWMFENREIFEQHVADAGKLRERSAYLFMDNHVDEWFGSSPEKSPSFRALAEGMNYWMSTISGSRPSRPAPVDSKKLQRDITKRMYERAGITTFEYPFLRDDFVLSISLQESSNLFRFSYTFGGASGSRAISEAAVLLAIKDFEIGKEPRTIPEKFEVLKQWMEELTKEGIRAVYTLTQLGLEWGSVGFDILFRLALIDLEYMVTYLQVLKGLEVRDKTGVEWVRALYPVLKYLDVAIQTKPEIPKMRQLLEIFWTLPPPPRLFAEKISFRHFRNAVTFENYVAFLQKKSKESTK